MGVTTDAQICNIALARIGQREFITALGDASTSGEVCNQLYGPARDVVLESVPWKFATRRATLALLASPDVNPTLQRDGWLYVYAIPVDCVSARAITVPGIRAPAASARIPFDIEADDSGGRGAITQRVLLTDQDAAELVYTAQVNTVALFSPLFIECLAWKLAADLALCIPVKPTVAAQMAKAYETELNRAAASQYRQSREDQPPASEFISVRGGTDDPSHLL